MPSKQICKSYNRVSFKPCTVWAERGGDYCRIHKIRIAKERKVEDAALAKVMSELGIFFAEESKPVKRGAR
jgi:hypothetical protein